MPADREWVREAIRRLGAERADAGETPWREFPLPGEWGIRLWFKDEAAQPTGSVKHRFVRSLFLHALVSGEITEGTTVVAATSGNAAVAGAYFARLLELPFVTVLPRHTRAGTIDPIERYGGRCRFADPPAAIYDEARRLATRTAGHYLDHFARAEAATDWRGHNDFAAALTGDGRAPEWIVLGAGTGASSATVGRYLRYHGLRCGLAVVDPENSAYFPGWATDTPDYATGMPSRIDGIGRPRMEPGFPRSGIDLVIPVPDAASVAAMRVLRAHTGIAAGPSSGANLWGACQRIAAMRRAGRRGAVHTVIADGGHRYRETFHDDAWLRAQGFDPAPHTAALEGFLAGGAWPGGG